MTAPHDGPDVGRLVARLRAAGCVFAEEEAALLLEAAAAGAGELEAMTRQRVEGLPLEHVLGWAQFHGLRVAVDPGVFVPRRRTEALVDEAARLARPAVARRGFGGEPLVVVDLCCGCGALGLALVTALATTGPTSGGPGTVELHAADVEPAAVRCARRNIAPVGGQAYLGDLYAALPVTLRGRVDVLLANVPYVPSGEIALMPPEARDHEPRVALDGGDDGLAVLRRVADGAAAWLTPGGHLLSEIGDRQAQAAIAAFTRAGLTARVTGDDEATAIVGTRPR